MLEILYRVTLLFALEASARRKIAQWNILKRRITGKKGLPMVNPWRMIVYSHLIYFY